MRLAVFTSHFPGRVNTFFARDVRGLIDAGIEVEIFAILPLDPRLWVHVPDALSARTLPRDRVHHFGAASSLRRAAAWAPAWRQLPHASAALLSAAAHGPAAAFKTAYVVPKALAWARDHGRRFDHVLAYWGNYAATCAYLFHRAAGRPTPFSMFLHAGTDLYRSRAFLRQKLLHADNIIVVCTFNREFLKATYPGLFDRLADRIHVHHPGIDLAELPFAPLHRLPDRLVAVGGLHAPKGFDDLLRAAAELKRRGRPVRIVIIGGGPRGRSLRALARRLGIEGCVEFQGWRPFEAVRDEMRRASLLVHPSTGLGDAVPTVIKEAMALGAPVVASAVAGIPELLDEGRCGALVPPRAPLALADAIDALLADEPRRLAYAERARARAVALFDHSKNAAALAQRLGHRPPQASAQRLVAAAAT
jgi:colanic acid/amylovoran biosynthesis glycosyltransferase